MEILSLLIGLILTITLIIFIARPLRQNRQSNSAESDLDALVSQRESLYIQIRELDFDHATGKVSDTDHGPLRERLVRQAADVLRQLDAPQQPVLDDDAIEAEIAARRKHKPATEPAPADSDPSEAELEAEMERRISRISACPNCGKPVAHDDTFCAKCGTRLNTQVTP